MARKTKDRFLAAALVVVLGTIIGGVTLRYAPSVGKKAYWWRNEFASETRPVKPSVPAATATPTTHAEKAEKKVLSPEERSFKEHFQAAVSLLQHGRYKDAVAVLQLARKMRPHVPAVFVNLGFAYLSMGQAERAVSLFQKALEIRKEQLNAYYGLAASLADTGDLEGALGAMRTYVHLTAKDDPFLMKAKSATWEWEAKLDARRKKKKKVAGAQTKNPSIRKVSTRKKDAKVKKKDVD